LNHKKVFLDVDFNDIHLIVILFAFPTNDYFAIDLIVDDSFDLLSIVGVIEVAMGVVHLFQVSH
jgi:hypothetical protein